MSQNRTFIIYRTNLLHKPHISSLNGKTYCLHAPERQLLMWRDLRFAAFTALRLTLRLAVLRLVLAVSGKRRVGVKMIGDCIAPIEGCNRACILTLVVAYCGIGTALDQVLDEVQPIERHLAVSEKQTLLLHYDYGRQQNKTTCAMLEKDILITCHSHMQPEAE